MTLFMQSHGGANRQANPPKTNTLEVRALVPAPGDVAVDEAGDFGYVFPPSGDPGDYLPSDVLAELDELGNLMVPEADASTPNVTPDSTMPAIMTYWGQFLDHELTARTDRESDLSKVDTANPILSAEEIETQLKNARTPRFDLDSVYGGLPVGPDVTPDVARVIAGLRHPTFPEKMRVGTCAPQGPRPDALDPHRDLPRFKQVEQSVKDAFLAVLAAKLSPADVAKFEATLDGRAIIGDMRNDENLIIAQFHVSFLRFHNRVVDFLAANNTGWRADFAAAQALTRLHYQWLIVEIYLKTVCDQAVVQKVLDARAQHFFDFRNAYNARVGEKTLGNAMALEFSVAAFRFGHSMVRDAYDYNSNFGRPGTFLPTAPFDQIFAFTGGGGFMGAGKVPENWIMDWSRFVANDPNTADGRPARAARRIDTLIAPPMGDLRNEALDEPDPNIKALFRHLARRNLRRGFSLRLPTGQALHAHLKSVGAVTSNPIADVGAILDNKPELTAFLQGTQSRLFERTPLWFYVLAEAEAAGGNHLGEVGSWIVASTFIATLLADPDSALSVGFEPSHSPLRMPDASPIDTIEKWMKFALVLE